MIEIFVQVFVPGREEIYAMLLWAKDSYRGAIIKKDADMWEKRIEMLKGLL